MKIKHILVVILCIMIFSGYANLFLNKTSQASGKEIYVDNHPHLLKDGSAENPYESINYALSKAEDGDTIYVFGGVYNETIVINKKISLIGSIDGENTIIDVKTYHQYTVEISADYVTLEGFNISDTENYILDINGALLHLTANNVIVQRNNFTNCSNGWGIYIDSSSDHVIGDNTIQFVKRGIYFSSADTNDIIKNVISNCSEAAIEIKDSMNNRFYNNQFMTSRYGIYARDCNHTNITSNLIHHNQIHGICLSNCHNDTVYNNQIYENSADGLQIVSGYSRINNNIVYNNQVGIRLDRSYSKICNNSINSSRAIGLSALSTSKQNIIYLNHFDLNTINAQEQGSNQWYFENQGNYWDDYNDVDRDFDGIGDFPYVLKGNIKDLFPLGIFQKPPNKPSEPEPQDDSENVGLKSNLSVLITDPDSDILKVVYFYDASDDSLIGKINNVPSGDRVSYDFILPFDKTMAWYVIVNDSKLENRSDIWFFTTKQRPPENEKPVADSGGPYSVGVNQSVLLNASSSIDPDGVIDFYRWNFGDGTSEILDPSPLHTYFVPGEYILTLTVVDNDGRSATDTTTVTVIPEDQVNRPPTALLFKESYTANASDPIIFDATLSYDIDGDVVEFIWEFSDGATDVGPTTLRTFASEGVYMVTLTVFDDDGAQDQITVPITINEKPFGFPGFEIVLAFLALSIFWLFQRRKK